MLKQTNKPPEFLVALVLLPPAFAVGVVAVGKTKQCECYIRVFNTMTTVCVKALTVSYSMHGLACLYSCKGYQYCAQGYTEYWCSTFTHYNYTL